MNDVSGSSGVLSGALQEFSKGRGFGNGVFKCVWTDLFECGTIIVSGLALSYICWTWSASACSKAMYMYLQKKKSFSRDKYHQTVAPCSTSCRVTVRVQPSFHIHVRMYGCIGLEKLPDD
eukprot:scpid90408/ scgid9040/ 